MWCGAQRSGGSHQWQRRCVRTAARLAAADIIFYTSFSDLYIMASTAAIPMVAPGPQGLRAVASQLEKQREADRLLCHGPMAGV